jgi:hypothetical protein
MTRESSPGDPIDHGALRRPDSGAAGPDGKNPVAVLAATSTAAATSVPPQPPTVRQLRISRGQMAAWTAAVIFAAVAGRFAALSAPAEFAVLGSGLLIFAWALRIPADRRRAAPERIHGRGSLAWLGLLAVFLAWELFALFHGSTPAHPTLSILLGPLLAEPLLRSAGYLVWLAAGVWIAKR